MAGEAGRENKPGNARIRGCGLDGDRARKRFAKNDETACREPLPDEASELLVIETAIRGIANDPSRTVRGETLSERFQQFSRSVHAGQEDDGGL
ncbi:hypothetical protein ACRAVF_11150 [Bradyrhizobium oligotrophicum S58]